MRHAPGLDAVRAAAVLLVVASHACGYGWSVYGLPAPGWTGFMGGLGVQLFFALSGLLIGRILLGVADRPTPDAWLRFMCRRWGRTLPLFWTVLALMAVLSPPAAAVGSHVLRWGLMLLNLGHDPEDEWFAVAWSLAVEEWFYLLAATALLAGCARWGRAAVWPVVGAFLLVPLAAREAIPGYGYHDGLLSLDCIAYGVALAALERRGCPGLFGRPRAAAAVGCLLILVAWWTYLVPGLHGAWLPTSPCLAEAGCCGLLVGALAVRRMPAVLARPSAAVALHSYSAYLVHLPVLALAAGAAKAGVPLAAAFALGLAGAAAAAHAGHALVEAPGMRLRPAQAPRTAAA